MQACNFGGKPRTRDLGTRTRLHALSKQRCDNREMAAAPHGYDSGDYLNRHLTTELLSKYKYGVASVSNITGRGNFTVTAIVKRPRKHSKPVYDIANIFGYISGEIREGFFKSNLREGEVLCAMKLHIGLSGGKWSRLTFAPVEEAAALCVLPLHEKAVEKGFGFPDSDTADAFECLKKVAQHCSYRSAEEFLESSLGKADRRSLAHSKFDGYRAELQAWLLEKEDLMHHNCPLPPPPPSLNPSPPGSFFDFLEQTTQALHEYQRALTWKKTAVKKFSSALNYERFCGMAKHQALWYAWVGDLDRANVMLDALRGLQDDQMQGKPLDLKNIVISISFDLTYCNLVSDGLYEGNTTADARLTPKDRCDNCLSHVTNTSKVLGLNLLTCVDKDGTGEFGSLEVRKDLAKLFFAMNKFGISSTVENAAEHLFEKALATYLNHAFVNLYWEIKTTNVMSDATKDDVLAGFLQAIHVAGRSQGELNVCELAKSCRAVLGDALLKNCGSKLGKGDIEKLCNLFEKKFKKVVTEFNKLVEEESSLGPDAATLSAEKINHDLILNNVVPFLAREFKSTWTFLSSFKKKKILTRESELVSTSCSEAFIRVQESGRVDSSSCLAGGTQEQVHAEGEAREAQDKSLEDKGCSDDSCTCKDTDEFQRHLINVLSSADNPVPFYKCLSNGNVVMSEELCSGKDGDYHNGMPAFDYERICSTIEEIDEERFGVCPVLATMCKIACRKIYLKFTGDLSTELLELMKKKNPRFEWHSCQACGQEEKELGEFKRCGGCKNVYYCGKKCQAQDWKAGHKQKCKTTERESQGIH